jgi:hypothetical protein
MRLRVRSLAAMSAAAALTCGVLLASIGQLGAGQALGRRPSVPKLIWGPSKLGGGRSAFPIYHRLGVSVYQVDLTWAEVAPTRPADPQNPRDPAYLWPRRLRFDITQARRYGISICLLVHGSPAWANGGKVEGFAPRNPADYANFLIAASTKYPSVHQWMIWGEPNRPGNFEPTPAHSPAGPRRYALLLNAAYSALKQVSPRNIVIGGDTWSFGSVEPADFLRWMRLPNGQPPPLDYYGHNPFSIRFPKAGEQPYYPGGRDINDLATLETQLRATYHRTVPLWLSEFTVSSGHPNAAFDFAVSRPEQAKWLTAAFDLANSMDFVAGMGWFDLTDQPPWAHERLTTGLMTWRLVPKPAFYAYEHAP